MSLGPIENPLGNLAKKGVGEALKGVGESVKEGLGNLLEAVVKQSKDIFKWFGNFFEKIKEKGLKESLMGPFIGFLSSTEQLGSHKVDVSGKKDSPKNPESIQVAALSSQSARTQLKEEVERAKSKPQPKPFDQTTVRSNPYEDQIKKKNGQPIFKPDGEPEKITLCSLTAKKNIDMLAPGKTFVSIRSGINTQADIKKVRENARAGKYRLEDIIPTGNADDVQQFYITARHEDCFFGDANEKIRKLNLSGKTVCDIVTKGSTQYDHRAAGFKGNDGNWYVLDPYRSGRKTEPIPFEKYEEDFHTDILFVVPIDSSDSSSTPSVDPAN